MYALLSAPKYFDILQGIIESKDEQIIYSLKESSIDYFSELEKLSNIAGAMKYLILDLSAAAEIKDIPQSVRKFRIKHNDTRIVIIAPGCTPGNSTIAELVSMGIYDIIAPDEEDQEIEADVIFALSNPASYAKAVKWDAYSKDDNAQRSTKKKAPAEVEAKKILYDEGPSEENIIETTIINDRFLDTVVIAVSSASRGIGCTHVCFSIAYFLFQKNQKFKIAVLEFNKKNDYLESNDQYPPALFEDSFTFENIDFYTNKTSLVQLLSSKYYDYIILDFGLIKRKENGQVVLHENYHEFLRAHTSILVCGTKLWQLRDIRTALYNGPENTDCNDSDNWKILFNFIDDDIYCALKDDFDWETFKMPFSPHLFNQYAEVDSVFSEMLDSIIPKSAILPNKRSIWPFKKK